MSWIAIGLGAALGAWLRWGLSLWLNPAHQALALGTLAANLGGSYLAGLAVGLFQVSTAFTLEWRLFIITGFLGGLTTFSTFSIESMLLLQRGHYGWAAAHTALHLCGSLICCFAGFLTCRIIFG